MVRRNSKARRGSAMVEFVLAGVAGAFILISTVALSYGMWNYHTLAYAVHEATRYAAVHGQGCTNTGNSCTITVANIATKFQNSAIGVPPGSVNVTLTTDSGVQTTCNPLNSCSSNATVWPPATNKQNRAGKNITIAAKYTYSSPLLFFWPGAGSQRFGTVVFPATSTQRILY
jgi:Flp pilus assembly protein TadG